MGALTVPADSSGLHPRSVDRTGGGAASALFATWLFDYLSERVKPQNVAYLGMRIDQSGRVQPLGSAAANEPLEYNATPAEGLLADVPSQPASVIELPRLPRELTLLEIHALLGTADSLTAGYCALLLSGVKPAELQLLHLGCLNEKAGLIKVPGADAREFMLTPGAWRYLAPLIEDLAIGLSPLSPKELDTRLGAAAAHAHLDDRRDVTALAIWHSYVLYLAHQGIELTQLRQRVGALPPSIGRLLASFTPSNARAPRNDVDWIHPELAM